MKIIKPVNGKYPQISKDCFIAENATIVGEVFIGKQCSVWFNAGFKSIYRTRLSTPFL